MARPAVLASAAAENDGTFTGADWGLFVGVSLIWGSSFLLIAEALESVTPGVITLGRVGFGALVLWGMRLTRPREVRVAPEDRKNILLLSVVWVAVPFTLFPLAQEHINSAVTGLLNGATPVFAGVVSALLVRVVPTGLQRIGIAIGFIGVTLISLGSASGGNTEVLGVALVLLATLCYGFAVNIAPPLQAKYGAVVAMSEVLGYATIWVLPFGLLSLSDARFELGPIAAVIFLGAVGTGLAYWIMSTLVGRVGGVRASFITYLIPVVSLVLGVTLRNDQVTVLAIVGSALTIGGAFIASRRSG